MASFGRNVIQSYGNRTFWLLYIGGAIAGGLCMQLFRPHNSIVIPEVGAGPAVSSLLTFYGLQNLQSVVFFFGFPIKMWAILAFVGFAAVTDPSKKDFGGMLAGLLMYQIFKVKMWRIIDDILKHLLFNILKTSTDIKILNIKKINKFNIIKLF